MKTIFLITSVIFFSGCVNTISTTASMSENLQTIKKNYNKYFSNDKNTTKIDKNEIKVGK